ncbi:MAG TPA: LacI family DNA-binding transcriptional regulator [Ornithinimicrobium sp.]|nr:LacI family DNA-binding transcriptional regulator [Ornithinimicrobium sp.]
MALPSSTPRATINDVARAAAVSRQTVSNALNAPQKVRPETLSRVRREIDRLGYRPSASARSMRSQRAGAVGVEINAVTRHASDVAQLMLTELTVLAPHFQVHLVPFAHGTVFPSVEGYQDMVRRKLVDAFVFADTHTGDPRIDWLLSQEIPFATFGRIYSHPELTCWVDVDGCAGTGAAVRHLLTQGYATVGYLGWPRHEQDGAITEDRREGWSTTVDALQARGPEGETPQELGPVMEAARVLLDDLGPGDAVVCGSDLIALGVAYVAAERGLRVGADLGVVGFDGSVIAARHGLTTVVQPLEAVADVLLRLVHDQLAGGGPLPAGQLLTPTLAPGASTDREHQGSTPIPLPCPGSRRDPRRRQEGNTP